MDPIIAHYKFSKVILPFFICAGLPSAIIFVTFFFQGDGALREIVSRHRVLLPALLMVWLGGVYSLWFGLILAKRALVQNRMALWVENGEIIFLHKWVLRAKCADIAAISYGTIGNTGREGINLNLRNGAQKQIPVESLIEAKRVIFARLEQEISTTCITSPAK